MRIIAICLLALLSGVQNTVAQIDTVSMSPGYIEQVFYSTVSGSKATAAMNDWDMAFATNPMQVAIRINDVNGVILHKVPNLVISDWTLVDTTGISGWDKPGNSIENWMLGAFNRNSQGVFDYGWGVYNQGTHEVNGDSLFVIELINTTGISEFKKLAIEKKSTANIYTFRYADLDGSNEVNASIPAGNYTAQNFIYYSIRNGNIINREPASANWNISFLRYLVEIPGFGSYPVTGVFSNLGVEVAEARGVDINTVQSSSYDTAYTENISEIGDDWKFFDGVSFIVEDSLVYFIKSQDDGISRIRFTGFEGSASGNIMFERTVLSTSVAELAANIESMAVYPTIASDQLTLVYSMKENALLNLNIISIDGRLVEQRQINATAGLHNLLIDVQTLAPGTYILNLTGNTNQLNSKFIVNK